jgi:hypothetical protein
LTPANLNLNLSRPIHIAIYLVIGSIWYYFIGCVLRRLVSKRRE